MPVMIPHSITIPGKGTFVFPREWRGKEVDEATAKRLYAQVCPEVYSQKPKTRDLPIKKR